jgi:hypothetical protein
MVVDVPDDFEERQPADHVHEHSHSHKHRHSHGHSHKRNSDEQPATELADLEKAKTDQQIQLDGDNKGKKERGTN